MGSACGQHRAGTGSAWGQHRASTVPARNDCVHVFIHTFHTFRVGSAWVRTWSAHGQHRVSTGSAQGQHGVSAQRLRSCLHTHPPSGVNMGPALASTGSAWCQQAMAAVMSSYTPSEYGCPPTTLPSVSCHRLSNRPGNGLKPHPPQGLQSQVLILK